MDRPIDLEAEPRGAVWLPGPGPAVSTALIALQAHCVADPEAAELEA